MDVRNVGMFGFAVVVLFVAGSFAQATTYTYSPMPSDLYDLDHYYYFAWGIDAREQGLATNLAAGEVISSAQLFIDDIRDWKDEPHDVLHVRMVDNCPNVYWNRKRWPGVSWGRDNQVPADKFAGMGTFLMDYTDDDPYSWEDLTIDLPIDTLTDYILNDNLFGFTFDPDCHYYNEGITLTITSSPLPPPPNVPEPMTVIGVVTGLGALGGYLRKRKRAMA